jgi:hypothetical protein
VTSRGGSGGYQVGEQERESKHESRQNPVNRLSRVQPGSTSTLLLFSLCLAAVSFHRGIAIAFPNRHLPINNHLSCHPRLALILPELLEEGQIRNRYCTIQGASILHGEKPNRPQLVLSFASTTGLGSASCGFLTLHSLQPDLLFFLRPLFSLLPLLQLIQSTHNTAPSAFFIPLH